MSLTFPASPTVGDTYTVGARTWTWSGTIWEITGTVASAGSIGTTELADSAITTAKIAANTVTQAKLDATLSGITICTSSTRPGSPFEGQTIFETDTNLMKVYTSLGWSGGTLHIISLAVDVLVVAGGGGSGYGDNAGGGGGGGLLYGSLQLARNSSTTISVGSGGTTSYASLGNGTNGVNSTIVIDSVTYTALGGGSGSGNLNLNGTAGGSGGGAGYNGSTYGTGGAATQTSQGQLTGFGNDGASGGIGRGGGGAGGAGSGQTGGAGLTYFGATYSVGGTGSSTNVAGAANTGNGGSSGGAGGSGIVIFRYLTTDASSFTITGGTATTDGSYTVRTFTISGSLVIA